MYKEIHPLTPKLKSNTEGAIEEIEWEQGQNPILLRLNTIREIRNDDSNLERLVIDNRQDVFVTTDEAEQIKKALLSDKKDSLSTEVSHLTTAIRDLWNLLRARMH